MIPNMCLLRDAESLKVGCHIQANKEHHPTPYQFDQSDLPSVPAIHMAYYGLVRTRSYAAELLVIASLCSSVLLSSA